MSLSPPPVVLEPFAVNGLRNTIPVATQIPITPGAASYNDGFPPLTMAPLESGGVPPFGRDMNGILYAISAHTAWQQGGGRYVFDQDFSDANNGYAVGAVLQSAVDNTTNFINSVDGNTNDPDVDPTDWVRDPVVPGAERTAAEIAASVTPSDYSYQEGDDRRYASVADWIAVVSQGVEGNLWTDHTTAAQLTITGAAVIVAHGNRSITATATMVNLLRHTSTLTIVAEGELLLDSDNFVTFAVLHSTTRLPTLTNVRFLDCHFGALGGLSNGGNTYDMVTGNALWTNVVAENCGDVGWCYLDTLTVGSRTAVIEFHKCVTKGTTGNGDFLGSGAGYLFLLGGFKSVKFVGGDYTGAATALMTQAFSCSQAQVMGGNYYSTARGPTVGENTQNFVFDGVTVRDISLNGISADTTDGINPTVGIGVISNCVLNNCGRAIRTTCSFAAIIDNQCYECGASGTVMSFAGTGDSGIWLDGNNIFKASTVYVAFQAVDGTQVTVGDNCVNSTARNVYATLDTATYFFTQPAGIPRTITANGDLRGNDSVIFLDCTAGSVDLDLFDNTDTRATGFSFRVVKLDAAAGATITFQGGAAHGETVNGATSASIPATRQYAAFQFTCVDGPAGTWTMSPNPVPLYTNTGANTALRSLDPATATTAQIANLVMTLLQDMKLRA